MRTTRARRLLVAAVALLTASAALPAAAAERPARQDRPSHGGLSAVIRYTEYGIAHILAEDYAGLGFGTGWAQAADQVCTLDTGSRGALLFDRFWRKLTAAMPAAQRWRVPFSAADPVHTPNTLNTAAPGFATALADAVAELRTAGIPLASRLGEHQFVVRDGQRIPVPGGTEALGVWNKIEPVWDAGQDGYTDVAFGSSHIQAVGWDAGHCPVARTLLTYSQSSNPNSPHHSDQTRLFSAGKWVTARFCEKDILVSPALKSVRVHEG